MTPEQHNQRARAWAEWAKVHRYEKGVYPLAETERAFYDSWDLATIEAESRIKDFLADRIIFEKVKNSGEPTAKEGEADELDDDPTDTTPIAERQRPEPIRPHYDGHPAPSVCAECGGRGYVCREANDHLGATQRCPSCGGTGRKP